ncbi:MAG: heat-shock protein Hsp70 [Deltaproteobacteria bacterium]|nr:MAG: heat-shock protein Hsp70 [Deltaproteobacteria bacterium]
MNETILGIDLGTTNSEVAVYENGNVTIIEGPDGRMTPSYVGLDTQNALLVGSAARNQYVLYPERTVKSIKRLMGEKEPVAMGEEQCLPQEISAIILKHLKQTAESYLGKSLHKAVITVPAFFSDQQRRATREAGEMAGLEVVKMINEPTAAALVYENAQVKAKKVLVYDLGGGTFDASLVRLQDDVIEVIASHGNNRLGGDDFDELVEKWILEQIKKDGIEVVPRQAKARIRRAAEEAKKVLSSEPFAPVIEEYLLENDQIPYNLNVELDRARFEEMITPLVDNTLDSVHTVLRDGGITSSDVDEVLLVGGSTNIPFIQQKLEEIFQKPPRHEINPDLCVASGAALQAATLAGEQVQAILVDVTPYTFGTSAIGEVDGIFSMDMFVPLIKKNTPVPVTRSEVFYTAYNNQEIVEIKVYQGEEKNALDNLEVGRFLIEGLAQEPAGSEIIATFSLNTDGILQVKAQEKATGLAKSITIDNVLTFNQEDLDNVRKRISRLFDDNSEAATGESTPPVQPQDTDAHIEELKARAHTLMDNISDDDREDLVNLLEDINSAQEKNDTDRINKCRKELSELLFFLES